MNDFLKDFFERATALQNAIQKDNGDAFKDVRLDILSQIASQVFIDKKIPKNLKIQSDSICAPALVSEILKHLNIEATINHRLHQPKITEVNAHVDCYWT